MGGVPPGRRNTQSVRFAGLHLATDPAPSRVPGELRSPRAPSITHRYPGANSGRGPLVDTARRPVIGARLSKMALQEIQTLALKIEPGLDTKQRHFPGGRRPDAVKRHRQLG